MKLLRIITALSLITLATTVSASENNHHEDKHSDLRDVFISASNDTSNKMQDYSDQFLVKSHSSLLNDKKGSFEDGKESNLQFFTGKKSESYDDVAENNLKHFLHGSDEDSHLHSLIEDHHFNEGPGDHEGYMDPNSWCHLPAPVPEPGSYALLLAGLFVLGAVKLRKS